MSEKNRNEKNRNETKNTPMRPLGHGKPVTRRELISQGLISGGAMVLTPSLLGAIYSQSAQGQEAIAGACPTDDGPVGGTAAIVIELVGGGNIAGANVFVGKRGGQADRLDSYQSLGGPATPTAMQYGLLWNTSSQMLAGINSVLDPRETPQNQVKAKVKGILYCSISNDDLETNLYLPSHHIVHAGAMGKIAKLVGMDGKPGGARSNTGFRVPGLSPVVINSPNDVRSIVDKHKIALTLNEGAMNKILRTSANMGIDSLCKISRRSLSDQMAAICGCRYEKSYKLATEFAADNLDPTKDPNIAAIFGAGTGSADACISKLVLGGNAGVGVILKDEFDYHDGTRTTGNRKDREAGVAIGQIIAYAATQRRAVSIMIITDGGVSSDNAGNWTADSGVRSAALQISYHPDGVKTVVGKDPQIGAYKNDGTVDASINAISNSPPALALAFTANYLALSGEESKLQTLFGDNAISQKLPEYLVYQKS